CRGRAAERYREEDCSKSDRRLRPLLFLFDRRGELFMQLRGTSRINEQGHLEIGGVDSVDLSRRFGTPLYVMDEQMIRERMRAFINAFRKTGLSFQVAYASKAFSTLA